MKNITKSAFTLVELIVVITILAVLGTIAFISFGGEVQNAKNSKIGEDLANIQKKVSIVTTRDGVVFDDVIKTQLVDNRVTGLVNSGSLLPTGTDKTATVGNDKTSYDVGTINFVSLKEKAENFRDNDKRDYVFAYTVNKGFATYEVAGNVKDQAGNDEVVLRTNYYAVGPNDVSWLISQSWSTHTGAVATWSGVSLY